MQTQRTAEPIGLFERSNELGALADMLATVADSGQGRLALVYGEAGIGKTALIRQFCEDASGSTNVLWGKCDELFTPRPLGPIFDIAGAVQGELAETLEEGATPHRVAAALEALLVDQSISIVVLEDMHVADEATLDVLRILGGRTRSTPALIVVSFRDDELDRWHPLRLVLAEAAAAAPIARLRLQPLSLEAVVGMASTHGAFGEELYRRTDGNPFYLTEALASGNEQIPETVRDAVLGRVARLSAGARRLIDAVAVAGPQADLWLLKKLAPGELESFEEATASGVVTASAGVVCFRHELARLAVEDSIPEHRRDALHRSALELLAGPDSGAADPADLAQHAEAVGDRELVLRFAPLAGRQASLLGAHREAAVHYRRALDVADLASLDARAQLSEACAEESFLIVELPEAVAAQRETLSCYEQLQDRRRQGASLSTLARLLWMTGSLPEGLDAAQRALTLLDEPPSGELVSALCEMARLRLAAEEPGTALDGAQRAQQLAEDLDDDPSRVEALQTVGWAEYFTGIPGGLEKLIQALEIFREACMDSLAATTCVIIVRTACRRREYALAELYIEAGLEHCSVGDYDVWRYYLLAWRSKVLLAQGHWSDAAQVAQICLADQCPFARIHALVALGLVRARRGDPDVWGPLDEALALAQPRQELQWIAPVAIARAEAAWLEGRGQDAIAETELASQPDTSGTWWSAGLAYWRWRAGADPSIPDVGEETYRLEMAGEWAAASERWLGLGCPYEAAVALLDADADGLQKALAEFQRLGANPAAKLAASRLRELGAPVPRGPRARTRENPAGLTGRELEVLALLVEGQRNAQIAQQLVVSEKTIDHHVSAILGKLGVRTRGEASVEAQRLGLGASAPV
jgi:DNA-binding CsgD family transcriptional regulator/tetratricopeptide (TPR) repeat protein